MFHAFVFTMIGVGAYTPGSPSHASDGPVAFSVELTDIPPPAEGEIAANLPMPDAHALYRGVFWQVRNVCARS